jgi:hypothetical protein
MINKIKVLFIKVVEAALGVVYGNREKDGRSPRTTSSTCLATRKLVKLPLMRQLKTNAKGGPCRPSPWRPVKTFGDTYFLVKRIYVAP